MPRQGFNLPGGDFPEASRDGRVLSDIVNRDYYLPDMARLHAIASDAREADVCAVRDLLSAPGAELSLAQLASLAKGVFAARDPELGHLVREAGASLRRTLFGNGVVLMAPVEISNSCASDCLFCGWRASNRAMKRVRIPDELIMLQIEYLAGLGIRYIEMVAGDDMVAVRQSLPGLMSRTRKLFEQRGIHDAKVNFCTLALTGRQYAQLREAGGDSMIVWQETYDPHTYRRHVVGGPKAHGIDDNWNVMPRGDGWRFRLQSQERALRADIEVAVGTMLGLNPNMVVEFLAVIDHARHLASEYGASPEHPIIVGMPVWNPITTCGTDMRRGGMPDFARLFPAIAALYLLALPSDGTWVFPNCRVPLESQIEAVRTGGAFTSTEVKLGPGGYLPAVIRSARRRGENVDALVESTGRLIRQAGGDLAALERALDDCEQFTHHYHSHETYVREIERRGFHVVPATNLHAAKALETGAAHC